MSTIKSTDAIQSNGSVAAGTGVKTPTTCPFDIPVISLLPHQKAGFHWGNPIRPWGDPCVLCIVVDPVDEACWYVGANSGLYVTTDEGQSFTKPLSDGAVQAITMGRGKWPTMYVGVGKRLYVSLDRGKTFQLSGEFPQPIISVLITQHDKVYVGLAWSNHNEPSGVYLSQIPPFFSALRQWLPNWLGDLLHNSIFKKWTFRPFDRLGKSHTGLILWTMACNPIDQTLYAGAEIFDHPGLKENNYHPPFFRSTDGGLTWENVTGALHWHVIATAVRPDDGFIYALTEGQGLFGSSDVGKEWKLLSFGPVNTLLMHPAKPRLLFGGRNNFGNMKGCAFVSVDGGSLFSPIGLEGVNVSGFSVNGAGTRLYVATYASGIYVSPIPSNII